MAYPRTTAIEIHINGQWVPAAQLRAFSDDRLQFGYLDEYVFSGSTTPVALGYPVGIFPESMREGPLGPELDRRPPAFLYDLVPQGRGRKYLLSTLQIADGDDVVAPLVMAGAFNPIGRLRLASAVEFFQDEVTKSGTSSTTEGFGLEDILQKSDEFLNQMSLHSMLASGTTGVQGVAPKFLLTTDKSGRWFADLALSDQLAQEHWLIKLPRGRSEDDRSVLRNEAAYLKVAARMGIRTHHEPMQHGEMLFVRRFDRVVTTHGVHRLHQESVASLCGQRGFGVPQSQQDLLRAIRQFVDDPLAETIEFMKRDVLNQALRNTDNHARNTAVQITVDGRVQLTPLFDFAPMFKDPEVVPRSCHWLDTKGVRQENWGQIIEALDVQGNERAVIAREMQAFASKVEGLESVAIDCGVEADIVRACLKSIEVQSHQLRSIPEAPRG